MWQTPLLCKQSGVNCMSHKLKPINYEHKAKMEALEASLKAEFPPLELKTEHLFSHGTYTRVLHIPAGTVLTGKIHRHSCINIITQGKMRVVTDEGEYDIQAPHHFVSGPGVKKAGYALEDTIWINVHPWNGTDDLEQIEHEVIIPSYDALENEVELCLGEQ